MPIEIRELIVKTTITNDPVKSLSGSGNSVQKQELEKIIAKIKKEIINECVQKVLDEIERNKER